MKLNRRNYFTFDYNLVTIHSKNNDRPRYPIEKRGMDERHNDNCSDWILHLSRKNWIDKEDLYDLAFIISIEFPKTPIDWHKTFSYVEMRDVSPFKGTPLSRTEIEEIVNNRLKSYNLN